MSKGMSFLKFGSVLNILFGVLFLLVGLSVGAVGVILSTGSEKDVVDLLNMVLSDSQSAEVKTVLENAGDGSYVDVLSTWLAQQSDVPSSLKDLFVNTSPDVLLMGVGFGLAGYTLIVNIIMSAVVLKKIKGARQGRNNMSRIFAIVVSVLSLLPAVISGILMLLGSFGHKPQGKNKQSYGRDPYGPRRRARR